MASQCPTPDPKVKGKGDMKGKGKGDWKGKGKGDWKGKGKGGWHSAPAAQVDHKGNKGKGKGKSINGACNSCGMWGHMARDCWGGKGSTSSVEEQQQYHNQSEYFEPYLNDVNGITGGFPMCSIDVHWNEVKTTEKNEMKAQEKKTKIIWKKMDMNTEAPVYNRYSVLGEDEEYPGGE